MKNFTTFENLENPDYIDESDKYTYSNEEQAYPPHSGTSPEESDFNVDEVITMYMPEVRSRKEWYSTTDPDLRRHITGRREMHYFGKGAPSFSRATREYRHLSKEFSRKALSDQQMSKKWDDFNGIDFNLIDLAHKNASQSYDGTVKKYQDGEISNRRMRKYNDRYARTLSNLSDNYDALYRTWANKNDVPLIRTQSSVSPLPFVLGTIGLPAAIIGGISGGVAAAPYIGKALANPWVQRGLAGLDVVDTGAQVVSGNYLGAATNLIPYDKIFKYGKKTLDTVKAGRTLYKQNKAARRASAILDENVRYKTHWDKKLDPYQINTSPYLYNGTDDIPIDSEAFYHTSEHYTGKDNNRSLTPDKGGWLGLKDGKLYTNPSFDGVPGDIWWNKGGVYSSGRTVYVSKSPLINTKVLDHPELYSPLRGSYHDSYYTSKAIPDKDVTIYERNPITHRMVNIHYNPHIPKNPHLEYDNDILHYSK